MQRFCYVLNNDGMAFTTVADYVRNFLIKSHAHLYSILHGIYNSYNLMKHGCGMGICSITVEDDTCKPKATSPCLSWKITWQFHDLHKGSSVRCMINHDGAEERQRNPPRLVFTKVRLENIDVWQGHLFD